MIKDLTSGNEKKQIISIFAPMLFTTFFQQLYNIVDTMVVGKFISKDALAAVGTTGNLNWLLIAFIIGFCSAESVLVSVEFGKKDFYRMRICIANGIYVVGFTAFLITSLSVVFCDDILRFMNTPKDIFDDAFIYFLVVVLGYPLTAGTNYIASIMRSVGNSKYQMYVGMSTTIINIFLDLLFVLVFNLGVFGVAIATFIATLISFIVYLIIYIKKFPDLLLSRQDFKFDKSAIAQTITIGVPMGLQTSINQIGCTLIQGKVNALGTMYVAAFSVGVKIQNLLSTPISSFASSLVPFVAQNKGAFKFDRIKRVLKFSYVIVVVYGIIVGLSYFLYGQDMALMYVNSNEIKTLSLVGYYSKISGSLFFMQCLLFLTRNYIQALAYSAFTALASIVELATRALIAFFFVPRFGFLAVCWSNPLSWIFSFLFLFISYMFFIKNKLKRTPI